MNFVISVVLFVLLIFPPTASALYYDRAGNPVNSLAPHNKLRYYTEKVKSPPTPGIKPSDRPRYTQEYNYIVDNECYINAVNLYLGETLYTCPDGVQFWSKINIDPSVISLNTKNRSRVADEESSDMLMMSSISLK